MPNTIGTHLDFIQNDQSFQIAQHEFGVLQTLLVRERFQIEIGCLPLLADGSCQRRLSALARPQKKRYRGTSERLFQEVGVDFPLENVGKFIRHIFGMSIRIFKDNQKHPYRKTSSKKRSLSSSFYHSRCRL